MLGGMVPWKEDMADNPTLAIQQGLVSMTPEVYENGNWRTLFSAYSRDAFGPDYNRTSYPRAWIAPDGQVFGVSADKMWKLDYGANGGNGAITYTANFKGTNAQGNGISYSGANPINVGTTTTAVMYDIGKVLILGGNGRTWSDGLPASDMVTSIDINGGTPFTEEKTRMFKPRRLANATVLANGDVVVTGGTEVGNSQASAVNAADIWNPQTNRWTAGPNASIFRGYHGNATLMPNGTILAYGGGWTSGIDLSIGLKAEFYYPPYLFKNQNGVSVLATRPVIKSISGLTYKHNSPVQLDMDKAGGISQLVLLGLSNSTHAFNAGQRRIPLNFTQEGVRISATIPNGNLTPPGYYQIVAIGADGVPSLGTVISVGQDVTLINVVTAPIAPPVIADSTNAPFVDVAGTTSFTVPAVAGLTYSWNFGDGSPSTTYSENSTASHVYTKPNLYYVTVTARNAVGAMSQKTYLKAVSTIKTAKNATSSSSISLSNDGKLWVVNPDNDSVSVINTGNATVLATISVGQSPRAIAVAQNGQVWVTNKKSSTISVINPNTYVIANTIPLPRASQPFGIAFSPDGASAFVALEAKGQLIKLNAQTSAQEATLDIGNHPRHVAVTADSATVLVSRYITPPLPGESTGNIDTSTVGGEVLAINALSMNLIKTIVLKHSDKLDTPTQGSGIPNYLGAPAISPDGTNAWVPSKQDNIKRGVLRNGLDLDFQNTVRAISSQINLSNLTENYVKRVDHDNSSLASAALYHPNGIYMFVALETSRQVAVVDTTNGFELFKLEVGRAPQGLAISEDGNTLYVHEFMDRSISVIDLTPLLKLGQLKATVVKVIYTVNPATEKLLPAVVIGKQLFYDAKDPRLSRDSYMSCASCHNDGGHDGRVWDLTGFGEGLRNTIALKGRAGMGHGFLHWSANFDEVQDFEKQIRDLAGGLGLMTDAQYNTGTRSQAMGDKKAGVSADLDLLATYLASLNTFDQSPHRNADDSLSNAAKLGKTLFDSRNCASCHAGAKFTDSLDATTLKNIGSQTLSSGKRLSNTLTGLDVPTLIDAWNTAPYLHDGRANTLKEAISAHQNITMSDTDLNNLVRFIQELGDGDLVESVNTTAGILQTLSITSPTTNSNYGYGKAITISAVDRVKLTKVLKIEFYDGSVLVKVDKSKPYSFSWKKFSQGAHNISAKAYYKNGTINTSDPINIFINPIAKRVPAILPSNAVFCANSGQTCNISNGGLGTVWFGYDKKWLTMTISGSVLCNATVFGNISTKKTKTCWVTN